MKVSKRLIQTDLTLQVVRVAQGDLNLITIPHYDQLISDNSFKAVTQVVISDPGPSVTPWALVALTLVFLLIFSRRLKREVWSRVSARR